MCQVLAESKQRILTEPDLQEETDTTGTPRKKYLEDLWSET